MQDTAPEAEQRYFELLAAAGPQRRLEAAVRLSEAVRELAEAGIRESQPEISPSRMRGALAYRLYGADIARRIFGYDEPGA